MKRGSVMGIGRSVSLLAIVACATTASATLTLYQNDFETGAGTEWSNQTITTNPGGSHGVTHFLGAPFTNGTVSLTLDVPVGVTDITLNYDLFILQSWDGNGPEGGGADDWRLSVRDGQLLQYTNFANYGGANTQAYPNMLAPLGSGGSFAPKTGATEADTLGWGWVGDTVYSFSGANAVTFPFAGPGTLILDFTSLQNQSWADEGWGVDNVLVTAIPEPASLVGFVLLGMLWRRR